MTRFAWRSLRSRIILLAILTCGFLATAAGSFYSFLRSRHQATVGEAQRHLAVVADHLAQSYVAQLSGGTSLRTAMPHPGPHDRPPAPPPASAGGTPAGPPPQPPPPPDDPLSQITAAVLGKETGIEGGFLAGAGPLVGYAFPSHEGPGNQQEMPARERPTIDALAHRAASTGTPQTFTFEGSHDVVLFYARPVRETVPGAGDQITGAAWLMQRLPDLNRGRGQQLLLASLGFGSAALLTALLAWFVTVEIRGGVNAVTRHLSRLEQDLSAVSRVADRPQLAEFERVLSGVDTMALALSRRIANERHLEAQLRHRERLSSLGQFAAGVAHELRNPLATIRLRAQMASQASAEGSVSRSSSVILEEVDRLDAMIARLLQFSRPISLDLQTVDIGDLCSAVAESWRQRAPAGISISCQSPSGTVVLADRNRLLQVLDNLVENAVQASSPAGTVELSATANGSGVTLEVADRGPGFSPAALEHAFDPFFTTRESGTGLGLSIAFELVEAHGGDLHVGARAAGGAVVTLRLPSPHADREVTL